MTIPTCSSFGRCKLSRILAGTRSFWECQTVLFHWLREMKRPPVLRGRDLKKRTKSVRFSCPPISTSYECTYLHQDFLFGDLASTINWHSRQRRHAQFREFPSLSEY